jgi:accessory Sec system glycosyltransferase GtfB
MEKSFGGSAMILLFEEYNQLAKDLLYSLRQTHDDVIPVCMHYDGTLPDDIFSPFKNLVFTSDEGEPLYFNKLPMRHYDRIQSTMSEGKIYAGSRLRGRIFYHQPTHKRYIKEVDYLDENGKVCVTDHYDLKGRKYAQTSFFHKIGRVMRAYYNEKGQEVVTENFITKDIIYNDLENNQIKLFKNIVEFTIFFLEKMGMASQPIYFTSLSHPFFVSQRMSNRQREDVLFWQEDIYDEIPGNMQVILSGESTSTKKIFVQKPEAYRKLIELGASQDMVKELGMIYDFKKNDKKKDIVILTNSDQIEKLNELVEACQDRKIHIAAITEMSGKLLKYGSYENVRLYPNITESHAKKLIENCQYYFDINYGGEILNAIREAFIHEMVIFAFEDTIHHHEYVAKEHIFNKGDMSSLMTVLLGDYHTQLNIQKKDALSEDVNTYKEKLSQ